MVRNGDSTPSATARLSMSRPQMPRTGATTSSVRFVATPFSKRSRFHVTARRPAVMEPPDTLDTRDSEDNRASSLSRIRDPTWKRAARNPPPDNARAVPVRSSFIDVFLSLSTAYSTTKYL